MSRVSSNRSTQSSTNEEKGAALIHADGGRMLLSKLDLNEGEVRCCSSRLKWRINLCVGTGIDLQTRGGGGACVGRLNSLRLQLPHPLMWWTRAGLRWCVCLPVFICLLLFFSCVPHADTSANSARVRRGLLLCFLVSSRDSQRRRDATLC